MGLTIMVRSRVFVCGEWISEWTETRKSWKAAKNILADVNVTLEECKVWSVDSEGNFNNKKSKGFWFVDIIS